MAEPAPVGELYDARHRERVAERVERERVARRLAWARLAAFVALIAALVLSARDGAYAVFAAAVFVAFAWLARRHAREKRHVQWLGALAAVNAEAASRARREWSSLPDPRWPVVPADHPYAADLDVIGNVSLSRLFPRISSTPGRGTLRAWVLAPAPLATIRERQTAVAELAPRLDFRDALAALGGRIWQSDESREQLEQWAVEEPWLTGQTWIAIASVVLPVTTVVFAVLAISGVWSSPLWLVSLVIAITMTKRYGTKLKQTLGPVAGKAEALTTYAEMMRLVADTPVDAPLLARLRAELSTGDASAARALESLRVLADCSEVRASPMLYVVLQAIGLWDFHIARLVERWHRRHGAHVARWFAVLGEAESLTALATLAHANPTWCFPDVDERAPAFDAEALGHPLLADDVRKTNDVTVGPAGTVLLVTGSNMSGKSTLLRSIGLAAVLAQAGGPVCARSLKCSPVALHTSMRISDSLEKGVSYFMAEVLRLKRVVDAARAPDSRGPVLYLVDEMLQGTNAAERTIATQRIVAFLASTTAIGALATHDLRVLDAPDVARIARLVHFREDVGHTAEGPVLRFDYRLREGPASSTNALLLIELAGLPVAVTDQGAHRSR